MFGIGGSELVIIAIIALIFLGPDKLPEATKKISRGIRELKKGSRTIQQTIENDEHIGGAIRDLRSALRGEEPAPRPPMKRRRKVKKKIVLTEEQLAATAHEYDVVEANADTAAANETVKLPPTAGEADTELPGEVAAADAKELAALIKPPTGTVAKAAAEAPASADPKAS
jgi:sec-independent protein translocase protein TatB